MDTLTALADIGAPVAMAIAATLHSPRGCCACCSEATPQPIPARPDAALNGAVLDPDKVCPTCRSSAFDLPLGNGSEAPVHCGHCQADLGSWSTFRRRAGRVLLLQPASGSVSAHLNPARGSRISHPSAS